MEKEMKLAVLANRFISEDVPILLSVAIFPLVTLNALWADWRPDIVWDFLYAQPYGPIFTGIHAVSILGVCVACYWMAYVTRSPFTGLCLGISVAAVHEIVWAGFAAILTSAADYGLGYLVILSAFLLLTLRRGDGLQRRTIVIMAVYAVVFYMASFGVFVIAGGTIVPPVNDAPIDTPLLTNIIEDVSWLSMCAFWFVPRRLLTR